MVKAADAFLEAAQSGKDCTEFKDEEGVYIRSINGSIQSEVAEDGDVRAVRFRRETVSLFDLQARVEQLEGEGDRLAALNRTLRQLITSSADALDARIDALGTRVSSLETRVGSLEANDSAVFAEIADTRTYIDGQVGEAVIIDFRMY